MKVFIVLLFLLSFTLNLKIEKFEPISFITCILKSETLSNDIKSLFKILSEKDYENQISFLLENFPKDLEELNKCLQNKENNNEKNIKPIKNYKYEECMKNNYLCHQGCLIYKMFNYQECIKKCPICMSNY
jgi:hypothetical protein